jgi:hypothetical protein
MSFICKECTKSFQSKYTLERHASSCKGKPIINEFKCKYCPKAYTRKWYLEQHEKTCEDKDKIELLEAKIKELDLTLQLEKNEKNNLKTENKDLLTKNITLKKENKILKCIINNSSIENKVCIKTGCTNITKSKKCVEHTGKRCTLCIDHIDSRLSNKKYDGYCATCFKRTFPEDERSKVIYSHSKEIRVRNFINEHFEGFTHNKPIYTHNCDCTHRRRIDHRKLIGNTILAIETDEHAHRNYDKYDEEIRYDDVYMIHSGKWIFIRFNPDGKDIDMEDKLDKLLEVIEDQIERIERDENTDLVEIIKLFY